MTCTLVRPLPIPSSFFPSSSLDALVTCVRLECRTTQEAGVVVRGSDSSRWFSAFSS